MSAPRRIGAYEILGVLGRGGMGVVYEARHPDLDRTVALKRVTSSAGTAQRRFEREGELLARVTHPHVVRVHELGASPEGPFLVTERVDGEALSEAHARKPFDPKRAATTVRDLAGAVSALHAVGVVHRDLKPENVIVRASDGAPILIDFGLAFSADQERLTKTGALVGTPQFMAPEQMSGGQFDERVDVYSLGAILYALLSGEPPFGDAESVQSLMVAVVSKAPDWSLVADAPRPLLTIVMRCMAKKPEGRYPSAAALEADLQRVLDGASISGAPGARSRLGLGLGAVAAFSLVALAVFLASPRRAARVGTQPSATVTPVETSAPVARSPEPGVRRWRPHKTHDLRDPIQTRGRAAFVGDGRVLLSGSRRVIRVWTPETDEHVDLRYPFNKVSEPRSMTVSAGPRGQRIVVAAVDEGLVIGALPPAPFAPRLVELPGSVGQLALLEADGHVLAGTRDGWIHRVDILSGEVVHAVRHSETNAVGALLVLGDSVVSTSGRGHGSRFDFWLRRWRASDLTPIGEAVALNGDAGALAGSSDGRVVLVGTNAGRVLAVSVDGDAPLRAFESKGVRAGSWVETPYTGGGGLPIAHETEVRGLAVSPGGQFVYSVSAGVRGGKSSVFRAWEFASGNALPSRTVFGHAATCLQLSPDGRQLLLGCWTGHFELWTPRDETN